MLEVMLGTGESTEDITTVPSSSTSPLSVDLVLKNRAHKEKDIHIRVIRALAKS